MGLAILVLVAFAGLIADRAISAARDRDTTRLTGVVQGVQSEILLALSVTDGYRRDFTIPDRLDGTRNYTITITNRTIIGRLDGVEVAARTIQTTGNVAKGVNTIRKEGGVVCINASCP